ncbi:MAG TPA: MFS transporter [Armatimonadota bacterium]|nr:MFS transporter [Armatimonadota bacterium]
MASDRRGIPWRQFLPAVAVMSLAEFAHGGLLYVLLREHGERVLRLSPAEIGVTISFYTLADLSMKVLSGALADRLGRRAMLVFAMSGSLATLAGMPFATGVWILRALVFLHGVSASPVGPTVLALTADRVDPERRSTAVGVVFTAWFAAIGCGFLVLMLLSRLDTRLLFGLLGVEFAVALLIAATLVPRGGRGAVEGRAARRPLLEVGLDAARRLTRKRLLVVGLFCQTLTVGLLAPVLAPYLKGHQGLGEDQILILAIAGGGLAAGLIIPMGRMADRVSKQWLMVSSLAASGLVLAGLAYTRSFPVLIGLVGVAGCAYALILPTWNALLLLHAHREQRALMLSAFMACEQLGFMAGPASSGFIEGRWGPRGPFLAASGVLLVIAAVYSFAAPMFRGDPEALDPVPGSEEPEAAVCSVQSEEAMR